jgi:hypothetical protein
MKGEIELKTLQIEEHTYEELSEILKEMKAKTVQPITYDKVIQELIDLWKRSMYTTSTRTVHVDRFRQSPSTSDPFLDIDNQEEST